MIEYQVWIIRTGGFGWEVYDFAPTADTAREVIDAFVREVCPLKDWRIVPVTTVARKDGL